MKFKFLMALLFIVIISMCAIIPLYTANSSGSGGITHYSYNDYFYNCLNEFEYYLTSEAGVSMSQAKVWVDVNRYNIRDHEGVTHSLETARHIYVKVNGIWRYVSSVWTPAETVRDFRDEHVCDPACENGDE